MARHPLKDWHRRAKAQTILASIDPATLGVSNYVSCTGSDYLYWAAGEQSEQLDNLRHAALVKRHGTFDAAWAAGIADQYLRFAGMMPSVADVLAERFGAPRLNHLAFTPVRELAA